MKMRLVIKIFCVSCAFLWLIPSLRAQGKFTLDQVFAKMDEVQKTFKSTAADIERTHVTVLVNDKDVRQSGRATRRIAPNSGAAAEPELRALPAG